MSRNPKIYLKKTIKKLYKKGLINPIININSFVNKNGNKHKCYICGNTFNHFNKYHGGTKNIPKFRLNLNLVDSDRDNFGCPFCSTFDRERHLFMFFDKLNFWKQLPEYKILHFAPEKYLSEKIESLNPIEYVKADFNPNQTGVKKVDATDIHYQDNSFDLVICNHVLEHIPNYLAAISEIYRVLKPKGIAILQTPFSKLLIENFEDENINTDTLRDFFYGEKDHYRIFSEQQFLNDLKNAGFNLKVIRHKELFEDKISFYYGVNINEDLIQVIKK
jgi:predicted SAM-dependent methyltransferase